MTRRRNCKTTSSHVKAAAITVVTGTGGSVIEAVVVIVSGATFGNIRNDTVKVVKSSVGSCTHSEVRGTDFVAFISGGVKSISLKAVGTGGHVYGKFVANIATFTTRVHSGVGVISLLGSSKLSTTKGDNNKE